MHYFRRFLPFPHFLLYIYMYYMKKEWFLCFRKNALREMPITWSRLSVKRLSWRGPLALRPAEAIGSVTSGPRGNGTGVPAALSCLSAQSITVSSFSRAQIMVCLIGDSILAGGNWPDTSETPRPPGPQSLIKWFMTRLTSSDGTQNKCHS